MSKLVLAVTFVSAMSMTVGGCNGWKQFDQRAKDFCQQRINEQSDPGKNPTADAREAKARYTPEIKADFVRRCSVALVAAVEPCRREYTYGSDSGNQCLEKYGQPVVNGLLEDLVLALFSQASPTRVATSTAQLGAIGSALGNPPWKAGEQEWTDVSTPLIAALEAFVTNCNNDMFSKPPCASLADDIRIKATAAREKVAAMSVPSSNLGWRTSVTAALEDLEEGARLAVDGIRVRSARRLEQASSLIDRGKDTMLSSATPVDPIPDNATPEAKDFWNLRDYVSFDNNQQCPADYWTLSGGTVSGEDEFERRDNAARSSGLKKKARSRTYVARLSNVSKLYYTLDDRSEMALGQYEFGTETFPIEIETQIRCTDGKSSLGLEHKYQTSLEGVRNDKATFRFHLSADEAKVLRSSWDQSIVYFYVAFQPVERPARRNTFGEEAIEGRVKAVKLVVNGKPVLAVVNAQARPWENAGRRRH